MDTRKFIQDIIDNELTMCFADCSQDNINKWVEILERYKKQLNIHSVILQSEQFSLTDIYKLAQNYTEEQFIEMVKHLQG